MGLGQKLKPYCLLITPKTNPVIKKRFVAETLYYNYSGGNLRSYLFAVIQFFKTDYIS